MKLMNIAFSNDAPNVKDCIWAKPIDNGFTLYLYEGGTWKSLKVMNDGGTVNVADDKANTIYQVDDITALTTKQCNTLNVGNQVIKKTNNQRHLYTVTYKEDKQGMCLSYIDAENAETVAYDWDNTNKVWEYTDTTVTPLVGGNNGEDSNTVPK